MKKFVIFDFDGTLLDTLKGLTNASNLLMEKFNYPYRYSYDEVKEFIGDGIDPKSLISWEVHLVMNAPSFPNFSA